MKNLQIKITDICAEHPILCTALAALSWFCFCAFDMYHSAGEFYFLDTDCYTRYLRITDWLNGDFSWYEKIFPFTNCPHGEILHFTRINDVLWLIFSLPFLAFLPLNEALFAGGMIFSPVLFVLTLSLILIGLRNYIGAKDFTKPSIFIFVFSFVFLLKSMVFSFGRPDHHSLMILISTFLSVSLFSPSNKKMFCCGIAAALGIWASSAFEGMLLAYIFLAILCVGIIFYKQSFDSAFCYTFAMFCGVLTAYALNPPFEGYLYFDNARLSAIHVAICGLTFAVFALCRYFNPPKIGQKIACLTIGALTSVAILLAAFGFATIFAPVYDERISKYFVPYISEMKPILPQEIWYFILGSLECLLLFRYFKRKNFADTALYLMFFAYLPFAVLLRRFLPYGILFFVFINALILVELFKNITKSEKYKWATLFCIVANLAMALSFDYAVIPTRASYPKLNGCALSDIFFAPQLIFKTGITTIGSPYHRNVEGIADTVEIFSSSDEEFIRQKLKDRKIKYIIIGNEQKLYLKNPSADSLYKNLLRGKTYDWLKQLNEKDEAFVFYEIIK